MKKVIFVTVLIISSLTVFSQSQSDVEEKRIKYGFNFGVNYSNLLYDDMLPSNASVSNNLGFRLGILADYKLSKIISVSPKAELSLNSGAVNFTNIDGSRSKYEVMPISLEFMTHFIFKKNNEKLSPYFFFGPNVKIPIYENNDNTTVFATNNDFAIDLGIGLDKLFTHLHFSPELRYSFGLLNVNKHPSVQSLNFHNISLVFNFLG